MTDIDALSHYWAVCPNLREALFKPNRSGYVDLAVEKQAIKSAIYEHPEFAAFIREMNDHFLVWRNKTAKELIALEPGFHPKELIPGLSDGLLGHYADNPLIDPYAVYQHLMDYWVETMQDDCYIVASDGWQAVTSRVIETNEKTGKEKDKGWVCDLVPKRFIVARYFTKERATLDQIDADLEGVTAKLAELEEEHNVEGGALELNPLKKSEVSARLREIAKDKDSADEAMVLKGWLTLDEEAANLKTRRKTADAGLDAKAYAKYATLSEREIRNLVVDDKWLCMMETTIHGEIDRVSQQIAKRIEELALRYETPAPALSLNVTASELKVKQHLERMGFLWQ